MNSQERGEPKRQRWKAFGKYLAALVLGGIVALVLDYGVSQLAGGPPQPPQPVDDMECEGGDIILPKRP